MKPIMVVLVIFFASTKFCNAQFISGDDKLHFGAGALISATTYAMVYGITKNKKKAFWYSLGTSTLAGLAKEVYDSNQENNKLDTGDMIATSLGGLTATVTINLFVGNRKNKRISFVPIE
ncbi:MAG: hypothetical protein B7Z06_07760 [Flavobacteriales bacterium 32-35-8]|nr:MAG: hypothetical protein B7Z06_07760 [Flavobacteriales bacterium 32-35-8]